MHLSVTLLVAGCLLGVVQLLAGIAVGMWLRRPAAASSDVDLRRAKSLALELHGLTQRIGGQVAEHRTRFEAADARLRQVPTGKHLPTTDLVVGVVGEVLAANRQLQAELLAAEHQIAEQAREIESHLTLSYTDALTSLPNRRALDDQLATRLQEYRKHGTPFSLLMVDLDHFKQINDTFGHPAGDEVLVSLGRVLRRTLRKHDFVARYGGEEFAVVLPHTTLDEARRAAAKVAAGVATLAGEFEYLHRAITVSGGLASIHPGEDTESLVRRADDALYVAKRNGRDCIYLHDVHECVPLSFERESFERGPATPQPPTAPARDAPPRGRATGFDGCSESLIEACDELRASVRRSADRSDAVVAAGVHSED